MGKRFYGSYFLLLVFIFVLSSILQIPEIFAEQGPDVASKETESNESGIVLKKVPSKDGRFIDQGDGTITDTKTGIMWTKKDSYADLGKCLNWNDSQSHVSILITGGYSNWRMPTVQELETIYEKSKPNNIAFGHDSKYPLYLDLIFADDAASRYWSSETAGSCCAHTVDFSRNPVRIRRDNRDRCGDRGVRAVHP